MIQLQAATNIALDLDDRPVSASLTRSIVSNHLSSCQNSSLCRAEEGVVAQKTVQRRLQLRPLVMLLPVLRKLSIPPLL